MDLFTQAELFDQRAVFVNVFLGVVSQEAFALTYHGEQGAARGVVLLELAQVLRKALDTIGKQGDLYFGVASVIWVFAKIGYDFGDFLFVVIDCHCVRE